MPKRSYVSSVRAEAAAQKRNYIIEAATQFLRAEESIAGFSLEIIAKAAGTTRLTVYNQFGSRRGLIEAVFDDIAHRGGIARLSEAETMPDPLMGLDYVIDVFCAFWGSDAAIGRIHDAMAIDPEIAQALGERLERGRRLIGKLVLRVSGAEMPESIHRDASDLIFALTGFGVFRMLAATRSTEHVRDMIRAACNDVVERMFGKNIGG